ncbi:DUF916 and DUF3324 domain-containing protein [Vagococcus fessus]|uniref:DUF916 and DUF3324 domain-containing protein n=1 Tax=Vagococcus fessus TaxID=120370 RepID=UPI0039EB0497
MKKNALKSLVITAGILFLTAFPAIGQASEFSFAVEPEKPTTQINKKVTYFDFMVKPKEEQTLKIKLRNDTKEEVNVESVISPTTTNLNGVVEYSPNNIKSDKTLKYNIKDLIKIPETIKIPKQSEKVVELKVTPPAEKFDGVISGGITFKDKAKPKEDKKDASGLSIKNEFSYVVAIVMHSNDTVVEPDLKLLDVYADQVNVRNTIKIKFQNPKPVFLNQLNFKADIKEQGKDTVLYQTTKKNLQVAPNTNFSPAVSLEGEKLKPGKYTATISALGVEDKDGKYPSEDKDKDGKVLRYRYKWDFTKDFEISSDVADKLNAQDVTIKKGLNIWWIIGLSILLLLLLLLIIYLIKRHLDKKKKEALEERQRLENLLNEQDN